MPRKGSVVGHRFFSEPIRKRFLNFTVHFDFLVRKENLEVFRSAWKQTAPRSRDRWGPFSDKADPALGLTIISHEQTEAGVVYHAIVEFRRDSTSPYTKISSRRMDLITERMRRCAVDIQVESLRHTFESKSGPGVEGVRKATSHKTPDGYDARITGISYALEKEDMPPISIHLDWGASESEPARLSVSTKGQKFATLADLFDTGNLIVDVPSVGAISSGEDAGA